MAKGRKKTDQSSKTEIDEAVKILRDNGYAVHLDYLWNIRDVQCKCKHPIDSGTALKILDDELGCGSLTEYINDAISNHLEKIDVETVDS